MPTDPSASASSSMPPEPAWFVPLRRFARHELSGAGVLLLATVAGLVWANSPWSASYQAWLHLEVTAGVGPLVLRKSLLHFVNDGLMGLFFFVVGLEIKREVLVGELASARKAALPALAAVGGMVVPALVYLAINPSGPARAGWGVPMATDIAFALGVLAVLGRRVPPGLKVLLTALAIVDDIGAVLVIAVFYTEQIAVGSLLFGLVGVVVALGMSRAGVRSAVAYFLVGTVVWLAFLKSGVHATLAALLMAFTIPARTRVEGRKVVARLRAAADRLERVGVPKGLGLNTHPQQDVLDDVADLHEAATAPLQELEHALVPVVTFLVLPLFALANAGVSLGGGEAAGGLGGAGLGIVLGLVAGKPLGIAGMAVLAVRAKVADLPPGVTGRHLVGVGLLGGIGFTMALFIAGLAFPDPARLASAKVAILLASALAAALALAVLWRTGPAPTDPPRTP